MSVEIDVKINIDKLFDDLEENLDATLESVGAYILAGAVQKAPTDTGLLKNSLTYAIAGEPPKKRDYRADEPDKTGKVNSGHYEGSTTKSPGEHAVLIGSNVPYAIYQEIGPMSGKRTWRYTPYLRPTVEAALKSGALKKLIETGLKGKT